MGVQHKIYQAVVQTCTEPADENNVLLDPQLGNPSSPIAVYAEPQTPGKIYENWGVLLKQPWLLMCDLADEPTFTDSAVLTLTPTSGGTPIKFQLVGWSKRYAAGVTSDHAEFVIRRLQIPPS